MQPVYNPSGYRYVGATIFLLVLQWVAALGRIGVRTLIVRKFGWDDVFTIITLLVSTGYDGIFIALMYMTNGGVSDDKIPSDNLIPAVNMVLGLICVFVLGTACLKIACGLLLLRVLVKPWQAWTIYSAMAITILYSLYAFFFTLFECGDPAWFHVRIVLNQCLSDSAVNGTTYTHSVLIAVIDCLFATLPIALIWGTDMSRRSKISVVAVLGVGSLACVCTFVRIGYVHDINRVTLNYFSEAQPLALLSAAELSIGVTCISICTFKPLFHRFVWRSGYYYGNTEWDAPDGIQQIRDPFGSQGSVDLGPQNQSSTKGGPFADAWSAANPRLPGAFGSTAPLQPAAWPLTDVSKDHGTGTTCSPVSPV